MNSLPIVFCSLSCSFFNHQKIALERHEKLFNSKSILTDTSLYSDNENFRLSTFVWFGNLEKLGNMSNIYNQLLKCAVLNNDLEEIKFCLARGADVNERIRLHNETCLHLSLTAEITVELIKSGADVNARDRYGQTPLYSAIANNKELTVVHALLCNGADINARDINGETPLHCAMIEGMGLAIVRELLRHPVDVNATDNAGKTALHLAVRWGNGTNLEVIKELLEFGADILGKEQPTALHEAADRGYEACVELLIKMMVLKKFDERKDIESAIRKKFNEKKVSSAYCVKFTGCDSLLNFLDNCVHEVVEMKKEKVSCKHSLFDIIKKNGDTIKAFNPTNKIIAEEIALKYPIYCDIILSNIKLSSERAVLLLKLKDFPLSTRSDGGNKIFLNTDCVYKVAEYLPNDHLYYFVQSLH